MSHRFVSRHRNFYLGVRDEVTEDFATGKQRVLIRGLAAQFEPKGVQEHEVKAGIQNLSFMGLPEDRETGGHVSPLSRLSVFDLDKAAEANRWTDEDKAEVLDALRSSDQNVANGGAVFIEVAAPKKPAPWKGYDRLTDPEKISLAVETTGVDPEEVIAYERDTQNRSEVLEALSALVNPSESNDDEETADELDDEVVEIQA